MLHAYFGNAHAPLEIRELAIFPWEPPPTEPAYFPTRPINALLIPQNEEEGIIRHLIIVLHSMAKE